MRKITVKSILKAKGYTLSFRSLKKSSAHGIINDSDISIDLRSRVSPAKIFIHEMVHYLDPKMSEKDVAQMESKLWSSLTYAQLVQLYMKIFT